MGDFTLQEMVDSCNKLAATFYMMHGCKPAAGFKFYEAPHPTEVLCWEMAKEAYLQLTGTCIDDVMDDLEYN